MMATAQTQEGITQPTLLFVPDISGFTKFVNETEIVHSRHIIEELLEVLIDANEMDLQVSEIEGDAILFYKECSEPLLSDVLGQMQRMYVHFHQKIKKFDAFRICQCGACCSTHRLQLKFFVHFGEAARKQVKTHSKLFGKEVIAVHRLMKNSVDIHEYGLLTENLLNASPDADQIGNIAWSQVRRNQDTYDFGPVEYSYLDLSPLSELVPEPRIEDYSVHGADTKVLELQTAIGASIEVVFDVVSDMRYRHHWIPGIKASTEINDQIPGEGTTHRCILDSDADGPFYVSHDFKVAREKVTWVESDSGNGTNTVITLQRVAPGLTRMTHATFLKANLIKRLILVLVLKKKFRANLEEALGNLKEYCEMLGAQGKRHHAHIELFSDSAVEAGS